MYKCIYLRNTNTEITCSVEEKERNDIMTLGNKIKTYRLERGMTQVKLAAKAGLSQAYLSELEKDKFNPTVSIITGIAVALDVPIDELLGISDRKKAG